MRVWRAFSTRAATGRPGRRCAQRPARRRRRTTTTIDADADADGDGDRDADELLLLLIDDGLLHHDLMPPLVGPPAAVWMARRLATLQPRPSVAQTLDEARAALDAGDLAAGRAALRALPGARRDGDGNHATDDDDGAETTAVDAAGLRDELPDVSAILVHQPSRPLTLDRATVARAARLAPLLFRLQEALTPPAAERQADGAAGDALASASELFGEGALDAAAWALGEYGVDPGASDDERRPGPRARSRAHRRPAAAGAAALAGRRARRRARRATAGDRARRRDARPVAAARSAATDLRALPDTDGRALRVAAGPARPRRRILGPVRIGARPGVRRRLHRARQRRTSGAPLATPPGSRLRPVGGAGRPVRAHAGSRAPARALDLAGARGRRTGRRRPLRRHARGRRRHAR